MTGKLGRGPVGQSVFFRLPDRLGFRKNSAGSTRSNISLAD